MLNALGSNITYAHSQFFRYIIPWLDDNDILGDFNAPAPSPAATGGTPAVRTTILNCVGCNVDVQIIIPEPQTSDDDSDIEAERNVDDSISGSVFRVLRPKPHQGGSSERAGSSFSTRSRSIFSPSADNHSRFQVVNEKIQNEYNNFSPSYFPGRILLYQDYNILLILHANRLVGLVNITRCIEKTPIVRKTKRAAAKKSVDASIYTLGSSDDEDDSSDRDYFDDSNPLAAAEDESVRAWMIQLIGYDG